MTPSGLVLREIDDSDDDATYDPQGHYNMQTDPEVPPNSRLLRKRNAKINYNMEGMHYMIYPD